VLEADEVRGLTFPYTQREREGERERDGERERVRKRE
jgi:hypothetical protein